MYIRRNGKCFWGSNCMCYTIPILKTEEEFWDLDEDKPSVNEVTDLPDNFKEWIRDNEERIDKATERGTLPYFIKDNWKAVEEALKPQEESKKTALEIAAERHAARTEEDVERIQTAWNQNRMEHLLDLSERVGSYKDPNLRNIFILLEDDIANSNLNAFKNDYKQAKQYIEDKIKAETELVRNMMQDPVMRANLQEMAKILGVDISEPMTFFEANVMRGNPNYSVSEAYRINCQTCVVANELRRRGLNLEALANTKGSWLEKLSRKTNEIWIDENGNIPEKTLIGARRVEHYNKYTNQKWYTYEKTVSNRKQLIVELESNITEDGRYHIDWCWNTQSKRRIPGHIITVERIDGVLRYYDPQNGKVISNFYDYINDIQLKRGINLLQVDNLRVNPEYASHILGKSGSKVIGGEIGKGGISGKRISYSTQRDVLKSDAFLRYDNTPIANVKSGIIKRSSKPRENFIKHCFNEDSLEAGKYIWEHPEDLKFQKYSELGETKDMSLEKNIKNIEKKRNRGIEKYSIYTFEYNGREWEGGLEVHKKGFEQFYYIK